MYIIITSKITSLNFATYRVLLHNTLSTTTSISLFFANKEYYPNISIHPECNIAFSQAHNFVIDLNKLQSTLKTKITMTQQHYQKSTYM